MDEDWREEQKNQVRRAIFHLRNLVDLYLSYGTVEDAEKTRATIAALESHLLILDERAREARKGNHGS
jgi:hypothetical protein